MGSSPSPRHDAGAGQSRKAPLTLRARAKVNLHLRALGRRPDGYTEILTVFQTISLSDRLDIRPAESGIRVECDQPEIPSGPDNLAARAAELFLQRTGLPGGVEISIEKNIPAAAGLGGGSSDAAEVLKGMNALHGFPLDGYALSSMAADLGSDVPFFLLGGTALGRGRGEILEPLPDQPPLPVVVVFPGRGVSTAEAYALLPGDLTGDGADISIIAEALRRKDLFSAGSYLLNDLEEAVFPVRPDIREIKDELLKSGARVAMMSGSGAACFGIYPTEKEAGGAASLLAEKSSSWTVRAGRLSPRTY
jgi:4-diphosphocytidyl-2-C-methyl-D-erythritol kinase